MPRSHEVYVPTSAGTYAIFVRGVLAADKSIIDIGECGPRPRSTPSGLRGRLASGVAHSASQRMARDMLSGTLSGQLAVVWRVASSKAEAKQAQDALLVLFSQEYGRQPAYNARVERCADPEPYRAEYVALKELVAR